MKFIKQLSLLALTTFGINIQAQEFEVNLQLRPRYEYRNGFKELMKDGSYPSSFVSQRSRLDFNYRQEHLKVKLTLQNLRNWGDASTVTASDKNGTALFEAWAQYEIDSTWSIKVGRQVLSYDNQRIMGAIDWAQQAQSHDAALITFNTKKHQLHLGFALNTDSEKLYEELYTTNYKNMQFAWYHKNFNKMNMSLLFLNNGYQYKEAVTDDLKLDYIQTFGSFMDYKNNKLDASLGIYGQTGKGKLINEKTPVGAYYAGIAANYAFTEKFKAGLGYEYLSGKDQEDTSNKIKSFYPLFGTNHAFNGLMDYFYVGSFKNNVGLQDAYLKLNLNSNKWQFNLTPHLFYSAANVSDPAAATKKMDNYLGTEIDFVTTFMFKKEITLSAGYSQMFGSDTLEVLKAGNKGYDNNWAWIMININPRIFTTTAK
ncbi:alginate export family protein [Flavobacterium sp. H122]|uniref:alginate export family protein n=1 Tax=Flavobacterium sp. H122 TaxID=2529860 RepID=UPI0020BFC786|nr:alginate export family protein [Flavobacterium sp. H122]